MAEENSTDRPLSKREISMRSRKTFNERVEKGLCGFCGETAEPNRKRCRSCADKQNAIMRLRRGKDRERFNAWSRESSKKRRQQHIEQGLCIFCNEKAIEGDQRCARHIQKGRKASRSYAKTHCNCGAVRVGKSSRCETCQKTRNDSYQQMVEDRRQKGLCVLCGEAEAPTGYATCEKCREGAAARTKERRESRLKAGLCYKCGVNPHLGTNSTCQPCKLKMHSVYLFKNARQALALQEMFDRQGGRCAYSGLPIEIGKNAELDHIIPESEGGKTELANLQWVHCMVNQMKYNFMEAVFLDTVRAIYLHRLA